MKSLKFYMFVFAIAVLSILMIGLDQLGSAGLNPNLVDANLRKPFTFGVEATTFQSIDGMGTALWWTIVAVLLIDIGCILGYLYYQRQIKWRRSYWRLMADNQRLLDRFAEQVYTKTITGQCYEIQKQAQTGGFYLALKAKKAPAPCGPALFG